METRITNLTSLPIGSYTIGINGKTISAGEYYHRVRSFVSASNPSKVPTVTAHILPKLAGGGVKRTVDKRAKDESDKVRLTRAEMLSHFEDEYKLNILRLNEGTKEQFFLDIMERLKTLFRDSGDVQGGKTYMTSLFRKMPVENLRHLSEILKFKKLPLVTAACYKGVFAKELEMISKLETDLKYCKAAMDSGVGLVFVRQFHKGIFNWDEVSQEVLDALEFVIKAEAGVPTDAAGMQI